MTLFQSLSLYDTLSIDTLLAGATDEVLCPGVEGENLAARALAELRARGWDAPPVRLAIEKRIPVAGGMAGGSADAAAALRLAMALPAETRPRAAELDMIAATLGADVPAQLVPGLSVGLGAGELVQHADPLAEHAFLVLPSATMLSTAEVFREADRLRLARSGLELELRAGQLAEALVEGARLPAHLVTNDLQEAALSLCPTIGLALDAAFAAGADHAIVSGSGPTVIGIWWGQARSSGRRAPPTGSWGRFPAAAVAEPVTVSVALPEAC